MAVRRGAARAAYGRRAAAAASVAHQAARLRCAALNRAVRVTADPLDVLALIARGAARAGGLCLPASRPSYRDQLHPQLDRHAPNHGRSSERHRQRPPPGGLGRRLAHGAAPEPRSLLPLPHARARIPVRANSQRSDNPPVESSHAPGFAATTVTTWPQRVPTSASRCAPDREPAALARSAAVLSPASS